MGVNIGKRLISDEIEGDTKEGAFNLKGLAIFTRGVCNTPDEDRTRSILGDK